jgi:hypothetical protein
MSAEVVGKNDETLWSYLVTPSNFPWNDIPDAGVWWFRRLFGSALVRFSLCTIDQPRAFGGDIMLTLVWVIIYLTDRNFSAIFTA